MVTKEGADPPEVRAFSFVRWLFRGASRPNKKRRRRIQTKRATHLLIRHSRYISQEDHMTKVTSFAVAFVLFAPIAAALLLQAAQIVA